MKRSYLATMIGITLGTLSAPIIVQANDVCLGNDDNAVEITPNVTLPSISELNLPLEVNEGEIISLSAQATVDTNLGGIASFYWCTEKGTLTNGESGINFIAPMVAEEGETIRLGVKVNDGLGYSGFKVATIHVNDSGNIDSSNPMPELVSLNLPSHITMGEPNFIGFALKDVDANGNDTSNILSTALSYQINDGDFIRIINNLSDGADKFVWVPEIATGNIRLKLSITDGNQQTEVISEPFAVYASDNAGDYTLHGTLTNEVGEPLENVTVKVGDKTTMTDNAGNWSIDGLFEGKYDIVATKDNFNCLNTDFELGNNDYHQTVSCNPVTSLKMLVKPSSYAPLDQGDTLTYTITVVNGGEQTATGVTLANLLPEGTSLVALESIDGQCDSGNLACTLPDLATGHTATVTLTLRADQADTVKTTMTLTSNEYPVDVKENFKTVKPYLSADLVCNPNPVEMEKALHCQVVAELSANAPDVNATNVTLLMQLAAGTQLTDITGTCNISEYPKVECTLGDLSIATPNSTSLAVVDINLQLTDASLLLLTQSAKVSATNYPDHTDRERTNIMVPPNAIADIVLVVDTTKSMDEEINGVIKAIEKFIQDRVAKGGVMPKVALVEFKDNVTLRAFTNDMDILLKEVRNLTVEGGGLCQEASAEALNLAISHTKEGGVILFSTDASPYPDTDMTALAERIKEKGIVLKALISGDCTTGQSSWNDVQSELTN